MTFKIYTLGCKVNAYESNVMAEKMQKSGFKSVPIEEHADIIIINTCTVTNTADSKSMKMIHKAKKEGSIVVACGCMVQNKQKIEDVDILIGNVGKSKIDEIISKYLEEKQAISDISSVMDISFEKMELDNFNKTRAFVKIQDGCNNFCSYCIIPYARGSVRSKKREDVLHEITTLINNGHEEIVLTGIHTGHYGEDNENYKFPDLLKDILKIKGLKRLRISSIEVTELNEEFLEVLKENPILVDHMHIPLQSGCDKTLKDMNRKYNMQYYKNKIETIRKIRPNISITTDLIVGFPNETEDDFKQTCESLKEIRFSKIHVFPYSRRKGTVADSMDHQIDEKIKKERVRKVMEISKELEIEYMKKFINKTLEFIPETEKGEYWIGHTGNYLLIKTLASNTPFNHQEKNVKISKIEYPYAIGILTK